MTILTRIASGLLYIDHKAANLSSRVLSAAARLNEKHAASLATQANLKLAAGESKARRLAESREEQAYRQLASNLRAVQEQLQVDLAGVYVERDKLAYTATSYAAVGLHCHTAACVRDERAAVLKGIREELRAQ